MNRKINICIIFAFMVMSLSCSSESSLEEQKGLVAGNRIPIELNEKSSKVAHDIKDFNSRLTASAVKTVEDQVGQNQNVVLSPLSVSMLLGMLSNGVEDDVKEEIYRYLGTRDLETLNELCNSMMTELPNLDDLTKCRMANLFCFDNRFTLNKEFSLLLTEYYDAEILSEDFTDTSRLLNALNSWCSKNTDGLINEIIGEKSDQSVAYLLNAMQFNSPWSGELFNQKETKKEKFNGINGAYNVDMMISDASNRLCAFDDNFESIFLEFGNRSFGIWILVPQENVSIDKATELIADGALNSIQKKAMEYPVSVHFPRLKIDVEIPLKQVLQNLGMEKLCGEFEFDIFERRFTGMVEFEHKSSIQLDEKGAVVASASLGDIQYSYNKDPLQPYEFKVNRPFFFFIKEYSTDVCVLSGLITHP